MMVHKDCRVSSGITLDTGIPRQEWRVKRVGYGASGMDIGKFVADKRHSIADIVYLLTC